MLLLTVVSYMKEQIKNSVSAGHEDETYVERQ